MIATFDTMLALTLHQPHASLIGRGKSIETRAWGTRYRGPLAIHAAKGLPSFNSKRQSKDHAFRMFCLSSDIRELLEPAMTTKREIVPGAMIDHVDPMSLPFGAIVAVAHVVDVHQTTGDKWTRDPVLRVQTKLSEQEYALGDYRAGRYAWILEDVQLLTTPVPCDGHQRLWPIPASVRAALLSQLNM